jgi:oligoendopeptidase F
MGSSASPADLTAIVEADINHPDFWRKSLKYIETLVDQLEALV